MTQETYSGGCQCGAVRYRISGPITHTHLCHCRMCQKAAGNYFMPLGNVQKPDITVTRGQVSWFESSPDNRRGFCRNCGTPLIFDTVTAKHLNVTLGSLDAPADHKPKTQIGVESRYSWFGELPDLPASDTSEDFSVVNCQHPDRDTKHWP